MNSSVAMGHYDDLFPGVGEQDKRICNLGVLELSPMLGDVKSPMVEELPSDVKQKTLRLG